MDEFKYGSMYTGLASCTAVESILHFEFYIWQ